MPGRGIAGRARDLGRSLAASLKRWRTARAIAELDDHLLRDIGMQGARPFERTLPLGRPELW
jgi:uncharacterized protein YjiS (DUF1127 family)